jgi:hypothetical protein
MLIGASVVGPDTDPNALGRYVEAVRCKCFPSAAKRIDPFRVSFAEREIVLDLKMELRGAAIASDAAEDQVIQRVAERRALRPDFGGKFAG